MRQMILYPKMIASLQWRRGKQGLTRGIKQKLIMGWHDKKDRGQWLVREVRIAGHLLGQVRKQGLTAEMNIWAMGMKMMVHPLQKSPNPASVHVRGQWQKGPESLTDTMYSRQTPRVLSCREHMHYLQPLPWDHMVGIVSGTRVATRVKFPRIRDFMYGSKYTA
jgi:hypothetical protein